MKKEKYKLPDKPVLYIAYGSNINPWQMAHRCPHSDVIGSAMVKDWELEFRGVATIVQNKNAEVPVLLWKLDTRDIPTLNSTRVSQTFIGRKKLSLNTTVRRSRAWHIL